MARFHRYSMNNICLIVSQRPTATRVAGFHTWRTMGRFVRKGEKGIAILAPIVGRKRDDVEDDSRTVLGFRRNGVGRGGYRVTRAAGGSSHAGAPLAEQPSSLRAPAGQVRAIHSCRSRISKPGSKARWIDGALRRAAAGQAHPS